MNSCKSQQSIILAQYILLLENLDFTWILKQVGSIRLKGEGEKRDFYFCSPGREEPLEPKDLRLEFLGPNVTMNGLRIIRKEPNSKLEETAQR